MNLKSVFYILVIFAICSCTQENTDKYFVHTEEVEIFNVVEDETGAGSGTMIYKESTKYKGKNKPVWRKFYEANGDLKGEERYIYKSEDLPSKSEYYDTNDSLLSTYLHTNDNNLKRRTVSMQGAEEEILRIEEFDYNKKGDRTQRVIKTAASDIDKIYNFEFDDSGNETSVTVKDGDEKILYTINYTITKKDSRNRWVEAWGFQNDKPIQVKYRKFITE